MTILQIKIYDHLPTKIKDQQVTPEITMEVLDQKIVAIFDRRFGSAAVGRFHQLWSFPDEKNRGNFSHRHPDPQLKQQANMKKWVG